MRHTKTNRQVKKISFIFAITVSTFLALGQRTAPKSISVTWTDNLSGDYSFKDKWSYEIGIYRNEYGQLVCDGLCPPESYSKLDSTMRIYKDSIAEYYKIIDTTHQFHTIECDASSYEFAGTDYIEVFQKSKDSFYCHTMCNPGTHSSLHLDIVKNSCHPTIELISIKPNSDATYYCIEGYIKIDKKLWKQGIMKAEFNFNFEDTKNPKQVMFWKGKIYATINKK